jgi:hypothetical protein
MAGVLALVTPVARRCLAFIAARADTALSSGGAGRTDIWSSACSSTNPRRSQASGWTNFPVAFTPARMREADVIDRPVATCQQASARHRDRDAWRAGNHRAWSFLALFLVPLLVRTGWGPDAAVVQAMLASLASMALFLDLLNRKEIWLVLGVAGGLAYLARPSPAGAAKDGRSGVARSSFAGSPAPSAARPA